MAKKSKIRKMRSASAFFFVAFIGLVAAGIAYLRHDDLLTGTEIVGSAFIPLAILFGFTLHTTCGVTTTRGTPCKKDSYGFLFGCYGNGHWLEKFFIRLGFRKSEPQQIQRVPRRQADDVQVLTYQPTPQTEPLRVAVETSARDIWGFWVGVVSMIATVVTVISIFAH